MRSEATKNSFQDSFYDITKEQDLFLGSSRLNANNEDRNESAVEKVKEMIRQASQSDKESSHTTKDGRMVISQTGYFSKTAFIGISCKNIIS